MDSEDDRKPGGRQDGKPYKDGNTRNDGSYALGKYRPPEEHQFRAGDGRKRGRRKKGEKNLLTEWREELAEKINITNKRTGESRMVSKRRAVIISQIDRGLNKSDRAAETSLRFAELSEKRSPGFRDDDRAIIEAWLASQMQLGDSDDAALLPSRRPIEADGVSGDD